MSGMTDRDVVGRSAGQRFRQVEVKKIHSHRGNVSREKAPLLDSLERGCEATWDRRQRKMSPLERSHCVSESLGLFRAIEILLPHYATGQPSRDLSLARRRAGPGLWCRVGLRPPPPAV